LHSNPWLVITHREEVFVWLRQTLRFVWCGVICKGSDRTCGGA